MLGVKKPKWLISSMPWISKNFRFSQKTSAQTLEWVGGKQHLTKEIGEKNLEPKGDGIRSAGPDRQ